MCRSLLQCNNPLRRHHTTAYHTSTLACRVNTYVVRRNIPAREPSSSFHGSHGPRFISLSLVLSTNMMLTAGLILLVVDNTNIVANGGKTQYIGDPLPLFQVTTHHDPQECHMGIISFAYGSHVKDSQTLQVRPLGCLPSHWVSYNV